MSKQLPKRVKVPDDVLFRELEGEIVLLNLDTERYYGLDDFGARLWQRLIKSSDLDEVLTQLEAEYEVDASTLRRDSAEFLTKLSEEGLVSLEFE